MSADSEKDTDAMRQVWRKGPRTSCQGSGWLTRSDDELLYCIEALPLGHSQDDELFAVVRSDRHFFIRQQAAKKVANVELLKEHSDDRHVGQVLVRSMRREEDVAYLRKVVADSRHLEVRKAAEAQLRLIAETRKQSSRPSGS